MLKVKKKVGEYLCRWKMLSLCFYWLKDFKLSKVKTAVKVDSRLETRLTLDSVLILITIACFS
jgi:hypothetical protein